MSPISRKPNSLGDHDKPSICASTCLILVVLKISGHQIVLWFVPLLNVHYLHGPLIGEVLGYSKVKLCMAWASAIFIKSRQSGRKDAYHFLTESDDFFFLNICRPH